ncbi:hypothetical protein P3T76_014520 [Phytophthora citrophthora]|uniref:Uncharacterized protein n=1 Tax=Phytophthora citrophthora TaxID=4793 RepID=A0AAD9LB40_9STRA|nr:hypothetical protein P3T76_014520 [Phytophthora citrophthora]
MSSIKWLLDNFPQSEQLLDYCLLSEAAKWGHLSLLEYFQSLPSSVPGFVTGSSQIQEDARGGEACFDALSKVAFGDEYR